MRVVTWRPALAMFLPSSPKDRKQVKGANASPSAAYPVPERGLTQLDYLIQSEEGEWVDRNGNPLIYEEPTVPAAQTPCMTVHTADTSYTLPPADPDLPADPFASYLATVPSDVLFGQNLPSSWPNMSPGRTPGLTHSWTYPEEMTVLTPSPSMNVRAPSTSEGTRRAPAKGITYLPMAIDDTPSQSQAGPAVPTKFQLASAAIWQQNHAPLPPLSFPRVPPSPAVNPSISHTTSGSSLTRRLTHGRSGSRTSPSGHKRSGSTTYEYVSEADFARGAISTIHEDSDHVVIVINSPRVQEESELPQTQVPIVHPVSNPISSSPTALTSMRNIPLDPAGLTRDHAHKPAAIAETPSGHPITGDARSTTGQRARSRHEHDDGGPSFVQMINTQTPGADVNDPLNDDLAEYARDLSLITTFRALLSPLKPSPRRHPSAEEFEHYPAVEEQHSKTKDKGKGLETPAPRPGAERRPSNLTTSSSRSTSSTIRLLTETFRRVSTGDKRDPKQLKDWSSSSKGERGVWRKWSRLHDPVELHQQSSESTFGTSPQGREQRDRESDFDRSIFEISPPALTMTSIPAPEPVVVIPKATRRRAIETVLEAGEARQDKGEERNEPTFQAAPDTHGGVTTQSHSTRKTRRDGVNFGDTSTVPRLLTQAPISPASQYSNTVSARDAAYEVFGNYELKSPVAGASKDTDNPFLDELSDVGESSRTNPAARFGSPVFDLEIDPLDASPQHVTRALSVVKRGKIVLSPENLHIVDERLEEARPRPAPPGEYGVDSPFSDEDSEFNISPCANGFSPEDRESELRAAIGSPPFAYDDMPLDTPLPGEVNNESRISLLEEATINHARRVSLQAGSIMSPSRLIMSPGIKSSSEMPTPATLHSVAENDFVEAGHIETSDESDGDRITFPSGNLGGVQTPITRTVRGFIPREDYSDGSTSTQRDSANSSGPSQSESSFSAGPWPENFLEQLASPIADAEAAWEDEPDPTAPSAAHAIDGDTPQRGRRRSKVSFSGMDREYRIRRLKSLLAAVEGSDDQAHFSSPPTAHRSSVKPGNNFGRKSHHMLSDSVSALKRMGSFSGGRTSRGPRSPKTPRVLKGILKNRIATPDRPKGPGQGGSWTNPAALVYSQHQDQQVGASTIGTSQSVPSALALAASSSSSRPEVESPVPATYLDQEERGPMIVHRDRTLSLAAITFSPITPDTPSLTTPTSAKQVLQHGTPVLSMSEPIEKGVDDVKVIMPFGGVLAPLPIPESGPKAPLRNRPPWSVCASTVPRPEPLAERPGVKNQDWRGKMDYAPGGWI